MRFALLTLRYSLEMLGSLCLSVAGLWAFVWWLIAMLTAIDPSRVPQ